MTRQIVAFCGPAGSGKTTAAKHLVRQHGFTLFSFAEPIKSMTAMLLMSSGIESPERYTHGDMKEQPVAQLSGATARQVMQTLGTEWGRNVMGESFWVTQMLHRIKGHERVVIDDVRFENESVLVHALGGKLVRMHSRGGLDADHVSERGVTSYDLTCFNGDDDLVKLYQWLEYHLISPQK